MVLWPGQGHGFASLEAEEFTPTYKGCERRGKAAEPWAIPMLALLVIANASLALDVFVRRFSSSKLFTIHLRGPSFWVKVHESFPVT